MWLLSAAVAWGGVGGRKREERCWKKANNTKRLLQKCWIFNENFSSFFFLSSSDTAQKKTRHTFYRLWGIFQCRKEEFINYTSRFHYGLPLSLSLSLCLSVSWWVEKNKHLINLTQLKKNFKKNKKKCYFPQMHISSMPCRFSYFWRFTSRMFFFMFHSYVFFLFVPTMAFIRSYIQGLLTEINQLFFLLEKLWNCVIYKHWIDMNWSFYYVL